MLNRLREVLGDGVSENEILAPYVWYKIGGPAKYFYIAPNRDLFVAALRLADEFGLQRFVLGSGSNILISDAGFDGFVIKPGYATFSMVDTQVICDAGALVVDVQQATQEAGLTGWSWIAGLPGTIGGAIRGNAGAYGKAIGDIAVSVDAYQAGQVITLTQEEMKFGYRDSIAKHESMVILGCTLQLQRGDAEQERQEIKANIDRRHATQPLDLPNVGCVFKNIDLTKTTIDQQRVMRELDVTAEEWQQVTKFNKLPTSFVVDKLGLKGKQIGGAQVSTKHAAFIVNIDRARAGHVVMLMSDVKMRVRDQLGIQLEEELEYVGF